MVAALILASAHLAAAQQPDRLFDMQVIASSLGVSSNYSTPSGTAPRRDGRGEPRQDVAREMIAVTRAFNATVQAAAGKAAAKLSPSIVTCHRGMPIPRS